MKPDAYKELGKDLHFLTKLTNKFKIHRVLSFLFFLSFFFRFCPSSLLEKLFLSDFYKKYNPIISLHFISSLIMVAILLIETETIKISGKFYIKYRMSLQEKHLLIESFYNKETGRFDLSGDIEINSGIQKPLESKRIIYRSSNIAIEGSMFLYSYNLNSYFLRFLNKKLMKEKLIFENGYMKFI